MFTTAKITVNKSINAFNTAHGAELRAAEWVFQKDETIDYNLNESEKSKNSNKYEITMKYSCPIRSVIP